MGCEGTLPSWLFFLIDSESWLSVSFSFVHACALTTESRRNGELKRKGR